MMRINWMHIATIITILAVTYTSAALSVDWLYGMDMQVKAALIGGVMGSVTFGIVMLIINWVQEGMSLRSQRQFLIVGILDDLERSIITYTKIEKEFEKSQMVFISTLSTLSSSRYLYEMRKGDVVIFQDEALRREIIEYYLDSDQFINVVQYNESRISNILHERHKKALEIISNNPEAPHYTTILQHLEKYELYESDQFRSSKAEIKKQVGELKDIKSRAEKLMSQLSKMR